jgi:hypothetical protein
VETEMTDAELSEGIAQIQEEDKRFREATGVDHGLPLGLDMFEVVTNSPFLNALLDLLAEQRQELAPDQDNSDSESEEHRWKKYRSFWLSRDWKGQRGCATILRHEQTGHVCVRVSRVAPYVERLQFAMDSMFRRNVCSLVTAEEAAREKLKSSLSLMQWESYVLSDCFWEVGRSGTKYLIRKNRPTLAFSRDDSDGGSKILCALCLHPLGYFLYSWTGFLAPSDEALTHALYIRSDEHFYWRKANQIPPTEVVSGV